MWGAIAGGAASNAFDPMSALSGMVGQERSNEMNITNAREANSWAKDAVSNQQAFETKMSNSSHQREVEDLRAAGLNPVLSANGGASTPASSASAGAGVGQMQSPLQAGLSSAKGIPGIEKIFSLDNLRSDTVAKTSAAAAADAAGKLSLSNAKAAEQQAVESAARTKAVLAGLPEIQAKGRLAEKTNDVLNSVDPGRNSSAKSVSTGLGDVLGDWWRDYKADAYEQQFATPTVPKKSDGGSSGDW
jgi:hypothetical protein